MDGADQDWKAAFRRLAKPSTGPCPSTEVLGAFVSGALEADRRETLLGHLASCIPCREDVVAARAQDAASAPVALRLRLYRLMTGRSWSAPRLAVAAALMISVVGGALLLRPRGEAPGTSIASRPEKSVPRPSPKTPEPRSPIPARPPELPVPVPEPQIVPAPEPPKPQEPKPEPSVTPKPLPESQKPAEPKPAPEKPILEPTRVALKGSVLSIAGSCSALTEGEAASQALRIGQKREFAGTLRLKADLASAKVSVGTVTYYLQRGAELSILLEEGRTKAQLSKGEAFFDVTPGQGQFVVEGVHGRVTVKGTRFLVTTDKTDTEVLLQKGSVEFAAAEQTVVLSPGEQSASSGRVPSAPQKADLAKRLSWVRALEESIAIEADQMVLQGGMTILPDPSAKGGRAIGIKVPLKAGQEAIAEIAARRKQSVPYVVWVRLHWGHGTPSEMSLSVGNAFTWSSKSVVMSPNWQWVRAGTAELADEKFRVRVTDTHPGMKIDQILLTTDPELNPENK